MKDNKNTFCDITDNSYFFSMVYSLPDSLANMNGISSSDLIKDMNVLNRAYIEFVTGERFATFNAQNENTFNTILKAKGLGVASQKLIMRVLIEFFDKCQISKKKELTENELSLTIPLDEYLQLIGIDLAPPQIAQEHGTNQTSVLNLKNGDKKIIPLKANKKEIERHKDTIKKAIKNNVTIPGTFIKQTSFNTLTDKTDIDLWTPFSRFAVDKRKNQIKVNLDVEFAKYLRERKPTYYHKALFTIDGRHALALSAGLKMDYHANIYRNIETNKESILSIKTLLSENIIVSIEELEAQGLAKQWKQRILKPFEDNLNYLIEIGFLSFWHYATPGTYGAEADPPTSYAEFIKLNVYFELKNPVNHGEDIKKHSKRIQRRIKRKADEKARKEAQKEIIIAENARKKKKKGN